MKKQLFNVLLKSLQSGDCQKVMHILGVEGTMRFGVTLMHQEDYNLYAKHVAQLLLYIREHHPLGLDWQYDAYLGFVYSMAIDNRRSFWALDSALKANAPRTPTLLIALADAAHSYESYSPYYEEAEVFPPCPLSNDDAISLAKESLTAGFCQEASLLLRYIYRCSDDQKNFLYWDKIVQTLDLFEPSKLREWGALFDLPPFEIEPD